MREIGASDVHLVTDERPYARLHGKLMPMEAHPRPLSIAEMIQLMQEIIPDPETVKQFKDTRNEYDGALSIDGNRYRVNVHLVDGGHGDGRQPSISIRALDNDPRTPEDLNIPTSVIGLTRKANGIVLVTGPTGSGKSTTLASLIDYINRTQHVSIITFEDPIEFIHHSKNSLIRQREIGRDTDSFTEAIRRGLRQDPDVILVGEMRDLSTIEAALTLAESGHLVFATLHTPDAPGSVDRIIDVFPEGRHNQIRTQLGMTLRGVVAQKLVPLASGDGRRAAFEVMLDSSAVRALIKEGKTGQLINSFDRKMGMITMEDSLLAMVRSGAITADAAISASSRPDELIPLLAESGFTGESSGPNIGIQPQISTGRVSMRQDKS